MNAYVGINKIEYVLLPEGSKKIPRDRYVQYMNDLYKLYPGKLSEETFMEGSQMTYGELGDVLLSQDSVREELNKIDTMGIAHWSQEFDPDYASCGAYFLHQYQLNSEIFDVCDQGTIASYTALKLLAQKLQTGRSHNCMLLCLEQTTVPRDKSSEDILPDVSGALAIVMSSVKNGTQFQLKKIGIIPEAIAIENIRAVEKRIWDDVESNGFDYLSSIIVIRKGSAIARSIKHHALKNSSPVNEAMLDYMSPKAGLLHAFIKLNDLSKHKFDKNWILLIDEDVESLTVAYVLLERSRD